MSAKTMLAIRAEIMKARAIAAHAEGLALQRVAVTLDLLSKALPEEACEKFLARLSDEPNADEIDNTVFELTSKGGVG